MDDEQTQAVEFPPELIGAAEAIGEIMEYWGFKRIHGALWTILYLEPEPVTQQQLMERTGYSKGAISMALGELNDWGVVRVKRPLGGRGLLYESETDLGAMIRNVLQRRERELLANALSRFQTALNTVEAKHDARSTFRGKRLRELMGLTQAAAWTLERFIQSGALPFSRLRGYFDRGLSAVTRTSKS